MMGFWYSSRNCFSPTHWAVSCPFEAAVLSQLLHFGGGWQCWQQDEPVKKLGAVALAAHARILVSATQLLLQL